jgi:hypothetical protein
LRQWQLADLYLYAACLEAALTPLWSDEIVTYQVAGLAGSRAVVEALLANADIPFCDFAKRNPRFLMLTGAKGWLFPKLLDDRAQIGILAGSEPENTIPSVTLDRPCNC